MFISPKHLHATLHQFLSSQVLPGADFQDLMMPEARRNIDFGHRSTPKKSAVLILLYPDSQGWQMILTKRNEYEGSHSAQICLPGGKMEDVDVDLLATALRETKEELGYACSIKHVAGKLSPVYIHVSNYILEPYIAVLDKKPDLTIDRTEVNYVIDLALKQIISLEQRSEKELTIKEMTFTTPTFLTKDDFIWGATAMVLAEFAEVLERCQLNDQI